MNLMTILLAGWLATAPFGHSFLADTHPDFVRLDIAALSNDKIWDYGSTGEKCAKHVFGDFGLDLPVWCGDFLGGKASVTLPMSACLWMDILEPTTSAVVNTDYRIAAPVLTIFRKCASGPFRNFCLTLAPFKHESTHIGDELVLQRHATEYAIDRVNVSYNYAEIKFTLNDPERSTDKRHSLRAGLMVNLQPGRGWYFVEEREGDVRRVPSARIETDEAGYLKARGPRGLWEGYLQYQFQTGRLGASEIQGVFSCELRSRPQYGYDLYALASDPLQTASSDSRALTLNVFLGVQLFGRAAVGLRAYRGNCPYGMFRSVANYSQAGLCIIWK